MPPKKPDKKTEKGQQKALEKQKLKIAEDKTFGLKNKNKSKVVQKYVKSVQAAAKGQRNVSESAIKAQEHAQKEEKKKEARQAALFAALFKSTESIKKAAEAKAQQKKTDPKSIKEDQLLDLYIDHRIQRKIDGFDANLIKTGNYSITCKHFLDAVEKKQCGWFWICPNGGDGCKYGHYLPEGYVLQSDEASAAEVPVEEGSWEDDFEKRRQALPEGRKLTQELFLEWKAKREAARKAGVEDARLAEAQKVGGGRGVAALSGRDLFTFDPSLFVDDAGAADDADYEEDQAEWDRIINQNQSTVDEANRAALETKEVTDAKTTDILHIGKSDLFLGGADEDLLPDLDELADE